MSPGRRTVLGIAAAALGTAAAGGTALVQRRRIRTRRADGRPGEFGSLRSDPVTIVASDGIKLYAEVDEATDHADGPTLVFVHGYALNLDCWHFQRAHFRGERRMVFYDQRSHGRSKRSTKGNATIDQLGHDLKCVLDQLAPDGRVVLIGHSMGGMTIMALADQRPDLFGERVVGAVLIGTSAGRLIDIGTALSTRATALLTNQILPRLQGIATRRAALVERGRRIGSDVSFLINRFTGFGANASPAQVEFVERMIAATPIDVISSFSGTFPVHDKFDALTTLGSVPVLVLAGGDDRLTPLSHAREITARATGAELVTFDGAGHMVMFERAPLVNLHLRAFLRRAMRGGRRTAARGA